jgi:large subunit ribosomal protein L1
MGATVAGSDDLLEDMSAGNLDFDLLITTQLMPKLAKLERKGLMPSPKSGTVTTNLKEAINLKGKLEYRADKTGIVHLSFKVDFSEDKLKENLVAVFNSIEKNKPTGVKGVILSLSIFVHNESGNSVELGSFVKKNLKVELLLYFFLKAIKS